MNFVKTTKLSAGAFNNPLSHCVSRRTHWGPPATYLEARNVQELVLTDLSSPREPRNHLG